MKKDSVPWSSAVQKRLKQYDKKVKVSLCFNWAPRHEGIWGEWRYSPTHSLTSALDGGEWSASRPGRFTPRKRAPVTRWIGGWVSPRANLDAVVKRKIPAPAGTRTPDHPARSPALYHWAIPAPRLKQYQLNILYRSILSLYIAKILRIYNGNECKVVLQWLNTFTKYNLHTKQSQKFSCS
jgi:hypothetical protein